MRESIVHFSGGSDSTLCAALELEAGRHVHLLTFDRISFFRTRESTERNFSRLCAIYGESRLTREVIAIDDLHRRVCYSGYASLVRRYGLSVSALAFSKIAMYWASARYARARGIDRVVDGSVEYMRAYPDQNHKIGYDNYRDFFAGQGIEYATPVFSLGGAVEGMLYDKGIAASAQVRGTENDRQVQYLEQIFLAFFLKYFFTHHDQAEFESTFGALYRDRLRMVLEELQREPRSA